MAKKHTSARGEQIDFDLLQSNNKDAIAMGNASMNANGDILGPGGKIIRKVEDIPTEIMADPNAAYNQANPKSTKMVSLKNKVDDLEVNSIPVDNVDTVEEKAEEVVEVKEKPKTKRKIVDSEE